MERLRKLVISLNIMGNDELKVIEKEQRAAVDKVWTHAGSLAAFAQFACICAC